MYVGVCKKKDEQHTLDFSQLVTETVNTQPATWETLVWSLAWDDIFEKGMVTHFSIFAWRIPWTEEPGELKPRRLKRVRHSWKTNTFTFNIICYRYVSLYNQTNNTFLKKPINRKWVAPDFSSSPASFEMYGFWSIIPSLFPWSNVRLMPNHVTAVIVVEIYSYSRAF